MIHSVAGFFMNPRQKRILFNFGLVAAILVATVALAATARVWSLTGLCLGCALVVGALYATMRQPPEVFSAVMSRCPDWLSSLFFFQLLWMFARRGRLRAGDLAPDFSLPTLDHTRIVRLSGEYQERPVVLVFGSYT